MYNQLLIFFAVPANAAIWAAFTRLVDEIDNFVHLIQSLDKFIQAQNQQTKGITLDKDQKFLTLVQLVVKYARKARVWASDNSNSELESIFNIHKEDFISIAQNLAFDKLINVRNALNTNIGSLAGVNVLPANITQIDNAALAYQSAEGAPGAAEGKKEVGTEGIEAIMHDIDHSLELIDDLLINEYADTEGVMVENYRKDRKIDTVGVHHTRLDVHITYSDGTGNAQGITMHVVEPNKTAISDIDGNAAGPNMKPGKYHVEFTGAGIVTKTIIQEVKRGTTVHLEVQVQKV